MKKYIRVYTLRHGTDATKIENYKMKEYDELAYNLFMTPHHTTDQDIGRCFPELEVGDVVSFPAIDINIELFFRIISKNPIVTQKICFTQ